jgi:hypothetical protein
VFGSGEVIFSGKPSTIVAPRVSLFLHFPFAQGLPLPSLNPPPPPGWPVSPYPSPLSSMVERKEEE